MKFDKGLRYVLSINLTYGGLYNRNRIMLTIWHTWEIFGIKDDLEGKVVFTIDDDI